ncbi:hypothetical protein V8C26DRAFT_385986 [Trichoderma gracile]
MAAFPHASCRWFSTYCIQQVVWRANRWMDSWCRMPALCLESYAGAEEIVYLYTGRRGRVATMPTWELWKTSFVGVPKVSKVSWVCLRGMRVPLFALVPPV